MFLYCCQLLSFRCKCVGSFINLALANTNTLTKCVTHLCLADSVALTLWSDHYPYVGVTGCFLSLLCSTDIPVLYANCVDLDQTAQNVASDQGLHSLQIFLLCDARYKWAYVQTYKCSGPSKTRSQFMCH